MVTLLFVAPGGADNDTAMCCTRADSETSTVRCDFDFGGGTTVLDVDVIGISAIKFTQKQIKPDQTITDPRMQVFHFSFGMPGGRNAK